MISLYTVPGAILTAILLLLAAPTAVLAAEVLAALTHRTRTQANGSRPRVAILVPAHNESTGIRLTLDNLSRQLHPGDTLLVVADNCTDGTAAIASDAGAVVAERHDTARRGKGFALDFGIRHLKPDPPQVVIVVDADCSPAPDAIDILARTCLATGRPVQALYLMRNAADISIRAKISAFAWLVKNQVRPAGLLRLSLPCPLTGSGMAFPWPLISRAQLATGHIAEDMLLGIELAVAGAPPVFCPDALVTSTFPDSKTDAATQRTRWEHGHMGLVLTAAPRLLIQSVLRADWRLFAFALDLCIPPLSLLLLLNLVALAGSALLYMLSGHSLPFAIALATTATLGAAIGVAWFKFGRNTVSVSELALAITYALAKIPLYLRFLVSRQKTWIRSRREGEQDPP